MAARAGRVLILLAEEEGDREGGGGGLGRLLQQAAQVSGPQVSVLLCFIFPSVLFYLIYFATVLNLK